MMLIGCDFSSAPTRRKPIVLALGSSAGGRVQLGRLVLLATLDEFDDWLRQPGPWLGGFDLPFGLPRELVEQLGWPRAWPALIAHYAALSRADTISSVAA
ncbi:MAG: DUF429 domain-containing protein, partial [Haliea sp.]